MDFGDFMMAPPVPAEVELDRSLYTMLEIEAKRYQGFFATLDEQQSGRLPRDVALAFYARSSLSEQEIAQMFTLIKSLQLLPDASAVNETEFTTGMHFIVCMTKRSLAKLPSTFPTYLFPTLDLTPAASATVAAATAAVSPPQIASSAISSMPSPDKDELQSRSVGFGMGGPAATATAAAGDGVSISELSIGSASPSGVSAQTLSGQIERLLDATSLRQLLERETRNKHLEASALAKLDASESHALASLRGCLDLLADSVERLGYPVPATARALDALDDFGNLLRSHAQATRQEIQSLEIAAQMLRVTADAPTDASGSGASGTKSDYSDDDPFRELAHMTQQLAALQQQAVELTLRKEQLLEQKLRTGQQLTPPLSTASDLATAVGAAPGTWGNLETSTSQQEVRRSESVEPSFPSSSSESFGAGAVPAPASAAPAATDFSWGNFS